MAPQRGTYRAPDGTLAHCGLNGDELEFDVEVGDATRIIFDERDLVKLSDDPFWPDGWDRNRGGWWPTD